jgi:dipeptidase D
MSEPLAQLEPRSVWEHFLSLTRIPRPSKHETQAVAFVREVAARHKFTVRADATGNLVVDVPASKGREKAPVVILQGHLDMVGEKNKDVRHDFEKDPILPRLDGEWVRATGTTLGADNGIGVAAALAAATDPATKHGPLQLLFTIDEETGLTGAKDLDGSLLAGNTLLNLDSEEDGVLFVGCAGGQDTHLHLEPTWESAPRGFSPYLLEVTGLRGGHSGLNIVENRGNALKLAARVLFAARAEGIDFRLAGIQGGSKHNAIPREADVRLYLADGDRKKMDGVVACMTAAFRTELEGIDDALAVSLAPGKEGDRVLGTADRDRLLDLLMSLPHGVLGMSPAIPGLVETSTNLAVVDQTGGKIKIVTSSRSSVMPTLQQVVASIVAAGRLAGARVATHDGYPGWKPNMSSRVLSVVREVYRKQWGREPKVTAIHAGLECGLLGDKRPGLDMISFGPQIEGAHSPDERVNVPSVKRFWEALQSVLAELSAA